MSAMELPGQLPTAAPPPNAPGDPRVRAPVDRQQMSIRLAMGQAYKTLGDALLREQYDPMEVAKGLGMLQQVLAMVPQPGTQVAPPSGVTMTPQTGIPRPVDRAVDPNTGKVPSGMTSRPHP